MKWGFSRLDELCTHIIDCPHSTPVWTEAGIRVLRSKNIRDGRLDLSAQTSFTNEDGFFERTKRITPRKGDLIITREAPMGEVCLLPDIKCCLGQRMVLLRPNLDIIDPAFLLYALQTFNVQSQIKRSEASGTTVSNLRLPHLKRILIPVPDLQEQRNISSILKRYDSKIENHIKRIELLNEAMLTYYDEWFHFLRFPGYEDCEIVDGVPTGWKKSKVGDCMTLSYGKSLSANNRREGEIPVFGSGGIAGYHDTALVDGKGIIVGRKGSVGAVFWVNSSFFPIDTVFYLSENDASMFNYCRIKNLNLVSTDAAVPGLNRKFVYSQEVLVPEPSLVEQFEELTSPMRNLISSLQKSINIAVTAKLTLSNELFSRRLTV
jgi:type I restriction enzyme, S subunit